MKDLIKAIFNIFRYTWKILNGISRFSLNIVLLAFIVLIGMSLISETPPSIKPHSILKLSIQGDLVEERTAPTSLTQLLGSSLDETVESETLIQDLLTALQHAKTDNNIQLVLLDTSKMGKAGLGALKTVGEEITRFKESGKKVVAVQDNFSQMQYYLASYTDTIILNPAGAVIIQGLSSYRLYFKNLLDKLEVTYNVFKVGSHKSALEPFTRNSMSSEDKQQSSQWLNALWTLYTSDINRERGLAKNILLEYTHQPAEMLRGADGDSAQLALDLGLVDKLLQRHEIQPYLESLLHSASDTPGKTISVSTYLASLDAPDTEPSEVIAIAVAQGNIVTGKQPAGTIGSETLIDLIKQAQNDSNIKALVLRIDSGGGSAFASELIRQQLLEFKRSGKPLVVSMGRLAASGGYWVSADADEIWASPATLTGSIGIFGAIPTFERSLASIGVYSDGTGTAPMSSSLNLSRALPQSIKDTVQISVEHGYRQFLEIVSTGRDIELTRMDSIAQGRVYAGAKAVELGLVDKLGTLDQAVTSAAKMAGLTNFSAEYLEKPLSYREKILEFLELHIGNRIGAILGETQTTQMLQGVMDAAEPFVEITDPHNIYVYAGSYRYEK